MKLFLGLFLAAILFSSSIPLSYSEETPEVSRNPAGLFHYDTDAIVDHLDYTRHFVLHNHDGSPKYMLDRVKASGLYFDNLKEKHGIASFSTLDENDNLKLNLPESELSDPDSKISYQLQRELNKIQNYLGRHLTDKEISATYYEVRVSFTDVNVEQLLPEYINPTLILDYGVAQVLVPLDKFDEFANIDGIKRISKIERIGMMDGTIIITDPDYYAVDLPSTPNVIDSYVSPHMQIKNYVPAYSILCNTNLTLVFKPFDNSPACVTLDTSEKLIQRGWGHILN